MAVSYPRGISAPKMDAKVSSKPVGVAPAKKGFSAAKAHHAHAGKALDAGNAKLAMHHIGHMMMALKPSGVGGKGAANPGTVPTGATGISEEMAEGEPIASASTSSGTDEGATSPTIPGSMSSAPSKKPSMAAAAATFARLRGK